jgi:hypothetical protein
MLEEADKQNEDDLEIMLNLGGSGGSNHEQVKHL